MPDGKHVRNGGTAGLQNPLAAYFALVAVECGSAVEADQIRGLGGRRYLIGQRSGAGVQERAPFYFAARNIEETAVADGAHAPPGGRLILDSVSDHVTVRRHRDGDR